MFVWFKILGIVTEHCSTFLNCFTFNFMTDNEDFDRTFSKLKKEEAYFEERLKFSFRVAYRNDQVAYSKWMHYNQKHGYDKACKKLKSQPKYFGKLKGSLVLGFKKNKQRQNAELAISDLPYQTKKLLLARLQIKELEDSKNQKMKEKQAEFEKKLKDIRAHTKDSNEIILSRQRRQ